HTAGCSSRQRNLSHPVIDVVHRPSNLTQRTKPWCGHAAGDDPVGIRHPVPLVVSAVQPNGDLTTRFEQRHQVLEGLLTIWRVMQNTNAVDEIEALRLKWQMENIRLINRDAWTVRQVASSHFGSIAEVDSNHPCAGSTRNVHKAARTTPYIEHQLPLQLRTIKPGFPVKSLFR